ncbi:TetR/AcrR family transcriptional regulator [Filimonas effusa]|nr:TetR/AcrR family transcriptional regulator [Filimonas effusa]
MKEETEHDVVKEHIVKVSKEVFRRYGLSKVSMDDLSKAAGKGRSTLYHYFKNKKEVFEACVLSELSVIMHEASLKLQKKAGTSYNLHIYYSTKLGGIIALKNQYQNLLEDLRLQPEIFGRLSKILMEEETFALQQLLKWGIADNEIAPMDEGELVFLSNALVTAFRSFEMEMALQDKVEDLENRLSWLINILYKGLK